jgi:hypothetical protein
MVPDSDRAQKVVDVSLVPVRRRVGEAGHADPSRPGRVGRQPGGETLARFSRQAVAQPNVQPQQPSGGPTVLTPLDSGLGSGVRADRG